MKVCLCILMNHPYPANIPILKRIYAHRFDDVVFLIPFARISDKDVFTVYRGSYCHSGYLCDAVEFLDRIDCDHFIVVHDDVLLNPRLNGETFYKIFPLGAQEGFIPTTIPLHASMSDWVWSYGHIARFLYPKSILFGSGVEQSTITRHLVEPILSLMKGKVAPASNSEIVISASDMTPETAIQLIYTGLNASSTSMLLDRPEAKTTVNSALAALTKGIRDFLRPDAACGERAALGLPMFTSAHYTDFYILPKRVLREFSHLIGISSAANLFVEIMTPIVLEAVCSQLRRKEELGLDFAGFEAGHDNMKQFLNERFIAIHPFKLSAYSGNKEEEENFLATYFALAS